MFVISAVNSVLRNEQQIPQDLKPWTHTGYSIPKLQTSFFHGQLHWRNINQTEVSSMQDQALNLPRQTRSPPHQLPLRNVAGSLSCLGEVQRSSTSNKKHKWILPTNFVPNVGREVKRIHISITSKRCNAKAIPWVQLVIWILERMDLVWNSATFESLDLPLCLDEIFWKLPKQKSLFMPLWSALRVVESKAIHFFFQCAV